MQDYDRKDISFIRRLRQMGNLKFIVNFVDKDLKDLTREDINSIVAEMHKVMKTIDSKADFIRDLKIMWKTLFPEVDIQGRPDETLNPYVVRHLKNTFDVSKEKSKDDRITPEEYQAIIQYFGLYDVRISAFLTLAYESLGRPQELCYLKIKDVELNDNYAKIHLNSHGKEGTGILQCIDSYPYLVAWLKIHPLGTNRESYLFVNIGDKRRGQQFTPCALNKRIRTACKHLGISKKITTYSFKRNGVTIRRLRGESDLEIQHIARWRSNKMLNKYDKTDQEDAMKISLVKRGLLKDDSFKNYYPKTKNCVFCGTMNGFTDEVCNNCKRPLNRERIEQEFKTEQDQKVMLSETIKKMQEDQLQMQETLKKIIIENTKQRIAKTQANL
jgi:integrase